jgi:hypothetical protein
MIMGRRHSPLHNVGSGADLLVYGMEDVQAVKSPQGLKPETGWKPSLT